MNIKEKSAFIKNSLTIEEVKKIVNKLGGDCYFKTNNILICETICHNHIDEEKSHKLYYYSNTKLFKCYTECADTFDIFELLIKVQNLNNPNSEITLIKAVKIIESFLNKKFNFTQFFLREEADQLISKQEKLISKNKENYEYNFCAYDKKILDFLDKVVVKEWIEEGISANTQQKYNIHFYAPDGQIIIPHYDINGALIGIRGRYLEDDLCEMYGKYRPAYIHQQLYNHPLSFSLYGLDKTHLNISKYKKAIIFEGEKSVMLYDSYFGSKENISVACCGSSISKQQIDLLLKLGVNEIIIALDRQYKEVNDEENKKYLINIRKLAAKMIDFCNVSVIYDSEHELDYKDSPIDKGKEIFIKLFQKRIFISEDLLKF
jgi:hypothetical protein